MADVPVPFTVIVYVPALDRRDTLSVSVEDAPEVSEEGENLALTPDGRPDTDNPTVCADPVSVVVVMEVEIERPSDTVPDAGLARSEKVPGTTGAVTASV